MKPEHLSRLACACVVAYAVLAGLHTLSDFDLGWQLASGRYWVQTGHLARQDVFSYTAAGAPWIYPPLSGLIFYGVFRLGGYTLLSLLCPLAAAGVALLLLRKGGLLRAWIVLLGVPAIVWRLNVRADMFTTVLAAVFLVILWEGKTPLWLLPVLMAAWVNLHPGFVLGVGLVFLFLLRSPKTLAPWAGLTLLATLANPWGGRIYTALWEQSRALSYQNVLIGEWITSPLSWPALSDGFRLRDPEGSYWLLLMAAALAVGVALWRRRYFGALVLAVMAAASVEYFRFQPLLTIAAAVVIPDLLKDLPLRNRRPAIAVAATVVLAALVVVRSADLVSGRSYGLHSDPATFGVGLSPWFPERALRFVKENKLPHEIYNDYNLGGYLTWEAWPAYPVFMDGRALPFGADLMLLQKRLSGLPPAHAEWQQTLKRWGIHTLMTSTSRFSGFGGLHPKLFCDSDQFRLVYLDDAAAVFVENGLTSLPALDCHTVKPPAPPATAPARERFRYLAAAGTLYTVLERTGEAEEAFQKAFEISDDDPELHMRLGFERFTQGRKEEAERHLRRAVALSPTSATYSALGMFYLVGRRYREAEECFLEAAGRRSEQRHESYYNLGQCYLGLKDPRRALEAFDRAEDANPFQGSAEAMGREFEARVFSGRARAFLIAGRLPEARRALSRARELGAAGPDVDRLEQAIR